MATATIPNPIKVDDTRERFADRRAEFLYWDFSFHQDYPSVKETCWSLPPKSPTRLDLITWQFCEENNLTQTLNEIVEKIHSFYKDCHLTVNLEVDPEIPDYCVLRIEITSDDSVENLLSSEQQFNEWFIDNISVEKQKFFAITYKI